MAIKKLVYILLQTIFVWSFINARTGSEGWQYIFPSADAQYVSLQTSLIFRSTGYISSNFDLRTIHISVNGERSGVHDGVVRLSDDNRTLVFTPDRIFSPVETVLVRVHAELLGLPSLEYRFTTSETESYNPEIFAETLDDPPLKKITSPQETYGAVTVLNGVAVPSDFPKFTPSILKATAPGKIFIGNWSWTGDRHYMMILENDGTPYFYQRLPNAHTRDFKLQPTGTLTRRVYDDLNCFVEMDSQYINIDTLRCGNGLGTDEHECQLLPDHHCFLIGLDYHTVDMSSVGGSKTATVIGNTVQELDKNHNVVFSWRSWDHFTITDAIHENMKGGTIDYVHMNSIAIDYDSNIVISSRHLSEITKINRKTGEIIWRLGGVHNQFTFVNDPYGFSYEHDLRPVPGKPDSYTMMDNGDYHSPNFSRAIEYHIDTTAMTATKTWEYRHTPSDYYTYFMGNVQRLPNGNTFIDWADASVPKATEVTPAGEVVYEANFEKSAYCYRAFRFEWESVVKVPYLVAESYTDKVSLIFNKFGDKHVQRYIIYAGPSPHPTTAIDSTTQTSIDLTSLSSNTTYYFRVTARDSNGVESSFSNEENVLVKIIPPGSNFILNGDFSDGSNHWTFNARNGAQAQGSIKNGEFFVNISNGGSQYSDIQLIQESFPIINGKKYIFEFDAYADSNRVMEPRVAQNGGSFTVYSKTGAMVITPTKKHFVYPFTMTDPSDNNARVVLNCGTSTINCYFDNVSVKEDVVSDAGNTSSISISDFSLEQNFPNPFNPVTTIQYHLPGTGERYAVSLQVYDMAGRTVATLENSEKTSGSYSTQWNASKEASGVYYCRLVASPVSGYTPFHTVRKILLLK